MAKILIADDSPTTRKQLEQFLTGEGHDVVVGEDGVDAVWLFKTERPDIVMLDVNMPIMTGTEALQKILLIDSRARVAMMTGEQSQEVVLHAMTRGARDFIVKPYSSARVMESIQKLLTA